MINENESETKINLGLEMNTNILNVKLISL